MSTAEEPKIGLASSVAIAVGIAIGGGLWVTPVVAGFAAGPAAAGLILPAAVPILLAFPAYFTLSKIWPVSPGHYYYPSRLLTPENKHIGQLAGWVLVWSNFFITGFFILPSSLAGGASFLHTVFPSVSSKTFTIGLLLFTFVVVWFGLRAVGWVEVVLAVLLLVAVGIIIAGGILHVQIDNLTPVIPKGVSSLLSTYAIVYTLGFGALLTIDIGGEIRDAHDSVDKAVLYGVSVDIVTAALVGIVVVGTTSYTQLEGQTLDLIAKEYLPPALVVVSGFGAVIAGLTTILAIITVVNRYIMAAADDGILPTWVGKQNKHGEPTIMLIVIYAGAIVASISDLPLSTIVSGYVFSQLLLVILVLFVGARLPNVYPEVFEHERVKESRLISPSVVRWSSICAILIMAVALTFLAISSQTAFGIFLLIAVIGVVIYVVRWWQAGKTILPTLEKGGFQD
ncbi:APC family permease [Halocatena marina]|uniref:APC family permease n=1 Tax=Halocatena marina TaxID=2934937 RepID=A0ABD5YYX2_9EURY